MRHALVSFVLLSAVAAAPLAAQEKMTVEGRVNKLEKEMKAVQRKVFPSGAPIQPDITPAAAPATAGAPTSTPLSDLTTRVDALEGQLRSLTGQVELDGNRLRKLEEALKALDTRLKAVEPQTAPRPTSATSGGSALAEAPAPTAVDALPQNVAAPRPVITEPAPMAAAPVATAPMAAAPRPQPVAPPIAAPAPRTAAAPVAAAPADAAKRKALVDAVEVPATGDAVEDAYSYAFRLWQAGLYPESQAKLKEFVSKNARHRRASYAQNLLGRAYLDEGKPALASVAFYENYTKNPRGERASESLYYLGVALTRLKKLPDACKVYDEFNDVYGSSASADLKSRVARGRLEARCI
ncbi:MAG: hypothetical protein EBS87_01425 [Sphingomonadaceae bacterium]|nr:hypothetical protein [Sphingomonadaceae bacterium]